LENMEQSMQKKKPSRDAIRHVADALAEFLRPMDRLTTTAGWDVDELGRLGISTHCLQPPPLDPPQIGIAFLLAHSAAPELDKAIQSLGNGFEGWHLLVLADVEELKDRFAHIVQRFGWEGTLQAEKGGWSHLGHYPRVHVDTIDALKKIHGRLLEAAGPPSEYELLEDQWIALGDRKVHVGPSEYRLMEIMEGVDEADLEAVLAQLDMTDTVAYYQLQRRVNARFKNLNLRQHFGVHHGRVKRREGDASEKKRQATRVSKRVSAGKSHQKPRKKRQIN
jgi:hypothetical protein